MQEKAAKQAVAGARLAYLDNLKVLLVAGMIGVHTAITYGVDGSWYLEDYEAMADASIAVLTVFVVLGYLFGLGAFFLIAGRLSGPSLARRGPRRFVRDRLIRLGVPVLFYVLLIAPAMEYVKERHEGGEQDFPSFAWGQLSDPAPGPTWFLEALLGFSVLFALVAAVRPFAPAPRDPLRWPQVAQVGAAIFVLSFATHLVVPHGEEHLHIQFALFPQYAILFALGCAAGRRGWLETLTPRLRRTCGVVGLVAMLALPALLLLGGFTESDAKRDLYAGGWHWQAAATSLVEATLAATLPLFLIGWFREHWTRQGPLLRRMAAAAYGAFIVHPPVVVGQALALHQVAMAAELKFLLVLAGGIAASFGLTSLAMRIPAVGHVIGSGRVRPDDRRERPFSSQPAAS